MQVQQLLALVLLLSVLVVRGSGEYRSLLQKDHVEVGIQSIARHERSHRSFP